MGFFGKLFGGGQHALRSQLPEVEAAIAHCIADFKKRTGLSYAHIFPIMQSIGVRLYVKDFGPQATRDHFERFVKTLTEDGTRLREDQFKNFRTPEIQPDELPHTTELNAILWRLSNDLVARGCQMETVAHALINVSFISALKSNGREYGLGLLMVSLKELRAGVCG